MLSARPSLDQGATLEKWMNEDKKTRCYVLVSMSNDLQCQHEEIRTPRDILTQLQELYGEQSHTAHFEVSQRFFRAKMLDG